LDVGRPFSFEDYAANRKPKIVKEVKTAVSLLQKATHGALRLRLVINKILVFASQQSFHPTARL
jgi:hypothetical protein